MEREGRGRQWPPPRADNNLHTSPSPQSSSAYSVGAVPEVPLPLATSTTTPFGRAWGGWVGGCSAEVPLCAEYERGGKQSRDRGSICTVPEYSLIAPRKDSMEVFFGGMRESVFFPSLSSKDRQCCVMTSMRTQWMEEEGGASLFDSLRSSSNFSSVSSFITSRVEMAHARKSHAAHNVVIVYPRQLPFPPAPAPRSQGSVN